ncbi:MAG: thioredoxin domain-containing protein [Anaerolineae bacterium]
MKRSILLAGLLASLLLLSFSAIHAQDGSPTAPPLPTLDPNRYTNLPQDMNPLGFPQIGFPSAPVSVVIFGGFDDPASGAFWRDGFPTLLARVRTGEVKLTYVPVAGRGTISGGRSAARAALCAGDQDAFWQYHDVLFTWQLAYGADAFAGSRLVEGATNLPIIRSTWDECMLTDRPDAALTEADAEIEAFNRMVTVTLPFITVNDQPSLTDSSSLEAAIQYEIERNVATFEAALNATPVPPQTVDPNVTPQSVSVTFEPLLGVSEPPPLIIGLPPGWTYGYDTLVLQDVDAIRNMPIAVYTGPITGGTGTIVLIWGFPNLIPLASADGSFEPNLWADGLRLLRLAVVEPDCNIGTDLRREYNIGGLTAIGTQFAAVGCPALPDTRGWFAGLQQFDLNFVFYVFADPIAAMDGTGADELQRILDSVRFVTPPTATPTPQ